MDLATMDFLWKVLMTLINLGIGVYLFWERHNDATARRIDRMEKEVDDRMDEHSSRLSRLETQVSQLPDHADMGDLHERINIVTRGVDTISGELTGIRTTLHLIHTHLLSGGKS